METETTQDKERTVDMLATLAAHIAAGQPGAVKAMIAVCGTDAIAALASAAIIVLRAGQMAPEWGVGLIRVLNMPEETKGAIDRAARELIDLLPVSVTDDVP